MLTPIILPHDDTTTTTTTTWEGGASGLIRVIHGQPANWRGFAQLRADHSNPKEGTIPHGRVLQPHRCPSNSQMVASSSAPHFSPLVTEGDNDEKPRSTHLQPGGSAMAAALATRMGSLTVSGRGLSFRGSNRMRSATQQSAGSRRGGRVAPVTEATEGNQSKVKGHMRVRCFLACSFASFVPGQGRERRAHQKGNGRRRRGGRGTRRGRAS